MTSSIGDIREKPASILYLNLFRICKEAFANVIKHSGAKTVTVAVDIRPEKLLLTVSDDGVGLDGRKKTGRGLWNMKARAEEMGGRVTVLSDRGTRVSLELPLPLKYSVLSV